MQNSVEHEEMHPHLCQRHPTLHPDPGSWAEQRLSSLHPTGRTQGYVITHLEVPPHSPCWCYTDLVLGSPSSSWNWCGASHLEWKCQHRQLARATCKSPVTQHCIICARQLDQGELTWGHKVSAHLGFYSVCSFSSTQGLKGTFPAGWEAKHYWMKSLPGNRPRRSGH